METELAGASAATAAGVSVAGVAAAFVATVPVALVADLAGGTATAATEFVSVDGWVFGWSNSYIFCCKAASAAACSGVSSARTELKPTTKAMHKPSKIPIFIKFPVFTRSCEHV